MKEKFAARESDPRPENFGLEILNEEITEERAMEIFDPKLELGKIKKLPREEKRDALEEYKEKLVEQKEGLADMQEYFIKLIRKNPDISFEELNEEVEREGKELGLTPFQRIMARQILSRYKVKHEAIKEIRNQYQKDSDLYKNLFGRDPKGKIEVVKGPMTLYFRCHDPEDYALIHSQAFINKRQLKPEDLEAANLTGGISLGSAPIPGLEGTIIAENVKKVAFENSKKTYEHEEQHAIKRLFKESEIKMKLAPGSYEIKTTKEQIQFFERVLRSWREDAEFRVKDEILAYLKSGDAPNLVFQVLTQLADQGGIYDYLKNIREKGLPELLAGQKSEKVKENLRKAAHNVLEEEYRNLIRRGIASFQLLVEEMKYSKEKATAILVKESLSNWFRVVVRMYDEHKKKPNK